MDRSLVASVTTAEADASIVAADGVETREQFDFLKDHGCQEAQRSHFSAAVDPESFTLLTTSDKTHSSV